MTKFWLVVLILEKMHKHLMQLSDFGQSVIVECEEGDLVRGTIGTPAFLAPECVQGTGEPYSGKVGHLFLHVCLFQMNNC